MQYCLVQKNKLHTEKFIKNKFPGKVTYRGMEIATEFIYNDS